MQGREGEREIVTSFMVRCHLNTIRQENLWMSRSPPSLPAGRGGRMGGTWKGGSTEENCSWPAPHLPGPEWPRDWAWTETDPHTPLPQKRCPPRGPGWGTLLTVQRRGFVPHSPQLAMEQARVALSPPEGSFCGLSHRPSSPRASSSVAEISSSRSLSLILRYPLFPAPAQICIPQTLSCHWNPPWENSHPLHQRGGRCRLWAGGGSRGSRPKEAESWEGRWGPVGLEGVLKL